MLKHLGRMLWSQSREIQVLNYKQAIVYQIYTANGYLYLKIDKTTGVAQVENKDTINSSLYDTNPSSPLE